MLVYGKRAIPNEQLPFDIYCRAVEESMREFRIEWIEYRFKRFITTHLFIRSRLDNYNKYLKNGMLVNDDK